MRLRIFFLVAASALLLLSSIDIEGRRGGGGGGRGGGAGGGAGGVSRAGTGMRGSSYARTPTMSRANVNRPQINRSVPGRTAPMQRPVNTQVNRQAMRQVYNQQNVRSNIQRPSATQMNNLRQNIQNNYPNIRNSQRQVSNNVQNALRNNHPNYRDYFGNNFYNRFNYQPNWQRAGYALGAAASWGGLNHWLGWGWSDPYYYDSGGSYVEVPMQYASTYSQDTSSTATAVPAASQQQPQGDWMALGVFAVSQSEQSAAYANQFVQLVVDKSGMLSGAYYNAAVDKLHPLDGFIDKDTQQAVWRVEVDNSPVMTAGIFNLTQDVVDVKVRQSNGSEQYVKLVRI